MSYVNHKEHLRSVENYLRKKLHGQHFRYDTSKYPFREALEGLFGCGLGELHNYLGHYDRFQRTNDQSTLAHKVFYANYSTLVKPLYDKFMKEFVATLILPHKAFYQQIPTFRVGLPGNIFVGEFHKDSDYNHQAYELNFNLGLSNYQGSGSLVTERTPSSGEFTNLECPYGEIFSFDHIDCLHGSRENDSDETIISFDFRLAIEELYLPTELGSVNMGSRFIPGEYFSEGVA